MKILRSSHLPSPRIGHRVAIYYFEGVSKVTLPIAQDKDLSLTEEDKGGTGPWGRQDQGSEG